MYIGVENIVLYLTIYERSRKKKFVCLFQPPMRGSRWATLLSSRRWGVQFQHIVITIVHTNDIRMSLHLQNY